jgi:hypothetical protein
MNDWTLGDASDSVMLLLLSEYVLELIDLFLLNYIPKIQFTIRSREKKLVYIGCWVDHDIVVHLELDLLVY